VVRNGAAFGSREFETQVTTLPLVPKFTCGERKTSCGPCNRLAELRDAHKRQRPSAGDHGFRRQCFGASAVSAGPNLNQSLPQPRAFENVVEAAEVGFDGLVARAWWHNVPALAKAEAEAAPPKPGTECERTLLSPFQSSRCSGAHALDNFANRGYKVSDQPRNLGSRRSVCAENEKDFVMVDDLPAADGIVGLSLSACSTDAGVEASEDETEERGELRRRANKLADRYCGQLQRLDEYHDKWRRRQEKRRLQRKAEQECVQQTSVNQKPKPRGRPTGADRLRRNLRKKAVRYIALKDCMDTGSIASDGRVVADSVMANSSTCGDTRDAGDEDSDAADLSATVKTAIAEGRLEAFVELEKLGGRGCSDEGDKPSTSPAGNTIDRRCSDAEHGGRLISDDQSAPGLAADRCWSKERAAGRTSESPRHGQVPSETDAAMLAVKYRFDPREVHHGLREFRRFDTERQGFLTRKQFVDAVHSHLCLEEGTTIPQAMLEEVFKQTDRSGDNEIDFEEYLVWAQTCAFSEVATVGNPTEALLRQVASAHKIPIRDVEWVWHEFNKYDANNSGVIERFEFKAILKGLFRLKNEVDIPESRMDMYWQDCDSDYTGVITFSAFLVWYQRFFATSRDSKLLSDVDVCPFRAIYQKLGTQRLSAFRAAKKDENKVKDIEEKLGHEVRARCQSRGSVVRSM